MVYPLPLNLRHWSRQWFRSAPRADRDWAKEVEEMCRVHPLPHARRL